MNYRLNSRLIRLRNLLPVVIFAAGIFFAHVFYAHAAEISPFDETVRLLERWTSSHWGQDCFVWVVHYPEEIADAWANSEALRSGMNDDERERFRKNFVNELELDKSETFLVSIYSFGGRPVNLSPVKENISLLASTGERIKPSRYDSALDYPSGGVVQGLVFFPKQSNKDYIIGIKGMGSSERIFSFAPPEIQPAPEKTAKKEEKKSEVVVVNLPKKQPAKKATPKKEEVVVPPPPPQIPARPITPLFREKSSDIDDFARSIRDGNNQTQTNASSSSSQTQRQSNIDNAYVSRESVLRKFLSLWAANSPNEMYDMLSESSKKLISRQNFAKEVNKSDVREGLKSDYKIDWIGEERAKVIMTRKTLIFKSVITRTLGITREGSSWRIVW
ncbi:MAG: hypothetical protein IJU48_02420 [Synergistaceae bacterium]|nr:hypothetical protein [Synergistaceae bacterium]